MSNPPLLGLVPFSIVWPYSKYSQQLMLVYGSMCPLFLTELCLQREKQQTVIALRSNALRMLKSCFTRLLHWSLAKQQIRRKVSLGISRSLSRLLARALLVWRLRASHWQQRRRLWLVCAARGDKLCLARSFGRWKRYWRVCKYCNNQADLMRRRVHRRAMVSTEASPSL